MEQFSSIWILSDTVFRQIHLQRWCFKVPGKDQHQIKYRAFQRDNFQEKQTRECVVTKSLHLDIFRTIPQRTSTDARTCARAISSSGIVWTCFSKIFKDFDNLIIIG